MIRGVKNEIFLTMSIEEYLNSKYDFIKNEITNRTYFKPKIDKKKKYELLKEYEYNTIYWELKNEGVKVSFHELKSKLNSKFVKCENPIINYFRDLPKWDGVTNHIQDLADTISTPDTELFRWAFTKWIVAMVSCAIDEISTNHTILILTGKQGIGKTTWLRKLVPNSLKDYFYSGIINPTNKDTTLLMSEKLLINLDELASLNKKQIENFKEMVTKNIITERRAYGHFTEDYIRRASFVGSSNHNEILMDVTGNRRFLCFETTDIQINHQINLDLVYSQALALLKKSDFRSYFNRDDEKRLEEHNKKFIQSSEEVDWIESLFEIPKTDTDDVHYLNATEISAYIKAKVKVSRNIEVQEIGKIMTSKGFIKKKKNGLYKYVVLKK